MSTIINRKNRHDDNIVFYNNLVWPTSIEQGNTKVEKKGKSLHERTFIYLQQKKITNKKQSATKIGYGRFIIWN